jgi:hypothetical protein
MRFPFSCWKLCISVSLILCLSKIGAIHAEETVLMSYGGHNETIGPYWVAIDKGFIKNTVSMRGRLWCATRLA